MEYTEIYTVNVIGGQWLLAICTSLITEKKRFGDIKKYFPTIADRMLNLQLKKLVEMKIVTRTVFAQVPPRVEYEPAPIDYELEPT
ncbi:winged helix-turn-helix transcriptional regulator [Chryseobacterium piperi]|uniref:winged helix-turn-helix transcriptional regulator n=1 Tax=Chryseobacterium piperi TaxID=558152 RepID=UPI000B295AB7|nr:helix-turn-helix domain-containing protein [Chryseobacterium piperi]